VVERIVVRPRPGDRMVAVSLGGAVSLLASSTACTVAHAVDVMVDAADPSLYGHASDHPLVTQGFPAPPRVDSVATPGFEVRSLPPRSGRAFFEVSVAGGGGEPRVVRLSARRARELAGLLFRAATDAVLARPKAEGRDV